MGAFRKYIGKRLTTTMSKTTKSTSKFKADDLDAIAAAGDWLLQKQRIGAKAAESWHFGASALAFCHISHCFGSRFARGVL